MKLMWNKNELITRWKLPQAVEIIPAYVDIIRQARSGKEGYENSELCLIYIRQPVTCRFNLLRGHKWNYNLNVNRYSFRSYFYKIPTECSSMYLNSLPDAGIETWTTVSVKTSKEVLFWWWTVTRRRSFVSSFISIKKGLMGCVTVYLVCWTIATK